jgi:3-oxoacyl-[acyl-carrier-protein] synthase-3
MSARAHSVRIVATGSYLPGPPITNEDMARLVGPLPEDVLEGIQVEQRHWIIDPQTGEHLVNNSDMALEATRSALAAAEIGADEVDLLVLSTASPDYLLPPLVTFVQEGLGLTRCATTEIRSGCAGAVEALDVARMYLERGDYRTAVVIGSEAISPLLAPVFLGKDPDTIRMRDRMNPYNFGDGAGAIVLRAGDEADGGILGSGMACVGGDRPPGMQIVGAGTHAPVHKQLEAKRLVDLRVDIVESGRFTPHVLTEALKVVLERSGVTAEEIDLCVIPEGNAGYMVEELREAGLLTPEWVALEDKIFENLTIVGATGSAAVPLALDHAWKTGRVKQGDIVMLLAIETSKWKYAGMVFPWTAAPYSETVVGAGTAATPAASRERPAA